MGWHFTFGIAMPHTIQVNDVILILPPAVGYVAAATLVVMFPKESWNVVVSCLKGG